MLFYILSFFNIYVIIQCITLVEKKSTLRPCYLCDEVCDEEVKQLGVGRGSRHVAHVHTELAQGHRVCASIPAQHSKQQSAE